MTASEPLNEVRQKIARACKLAGRNPAGVTLVAISKTRTPEEIGPLVVAGQRVFGENRVQEVQAKWPEILRGGPEFELHLVGQLQSNKAAEAVALFDVIHSLDRPSLIDALARAQAASGKARRYFIQINIGDESQKGGCAIGDLPDLLARARAGQLNVSGLMAVPPAHTEAAPYFALLAKEARDCGLAELSMGMSGDFETAIMLGATHIRVGSALFGSRV